MTPEGRAGLRRGHYLMETTTAHRGARSYCAKDSEDWPCPTIRLLDALDAATARADAADLRAEALLRRVAALTAALPDPGALLLLADWLDATDRPGQGNEVQTDLRRWADAAVRAGVPRRMEE